MNNLNWALQVITAFVIRHSNFEFSCLVIKITQSLKVVVFDNLKLGVALISFKINIKSIDNI